MGNSNSISKVVKNLTPENEKKCLGIMKHIDCKNVTVQTANGKITLLLLAYKHQCFNIFNYLLKIGSNPYTVEYNNDDLNVVDTIIKNDDLQNFRTICHYFTNSISHERVMYSVINNIRSKKILGYMLSKNVIHQHIIETNAKNEIFINYVHNLSNFTIIGHNFNYNEKFDKDPYFLEITSKFNIVPDKLMLHNFLLNKNMSKLDVIIPIYNYLNSKYENYVGTKDENGKTILQLFLEMAYDVDIYIQYMLLKFFVDKGENILEGNGDSSCIHLIFANLKCNFMEIIEDYILIENYIDIILVQIEKFKSNQLYAALKKVVNNEVTLEGYKAPYMHHYIKYSSYDNREIELFDTFNNINATAEGRTLLEIELCKKKNSIPRIQLLLENGADINRLGNYNTGQKISLLSHVCAFKSTNVASMFLNRPECNVNILNEDNSNALIYCVKKRKVKICEMLINKGINKNHRDNAGKSALDYCKSDALKSKLRGGVKKKAHIHEYYNPTRTSEPPEVGASMECKICCSNKIEILNLPCKHACMCNECYQHMPANGKKCIVCRSKVNHVVDIII